MRVLWVALMLAGAILLTLNGVGHFYRLFVLRDEPVALAIRLLPSTFWGALSFAGAIVCAAGIFLKPSEFRELTAERPVPRAAWLEEMREQQRAARQGESAEQGKGE